MRTVDVYKRQDEDESFDDESRREFSEIIKVNSFQLLKLINDILDFSDFENDNITLSLIHI